MKRFLLKTIVLSKGAGAESPGNDHAKVRVMARDISLLMLS